MISFTRKFFPVKNELEKHEFNFTRRSEARFLCCVHLIFDLMISINDIGYG